MAEGEGERAELVYLNYEDALEIFAAIIGGSTQQAADQLRSPAALAGALGRPASYAHYEQADLALQAVVLAHGIAETQAFLDGNKRVALVSMLTFLELNGCRVKATDRELADWIISFSAGATPTDVADQLRPRLEPAVV